MVPRTFSHPAGALGGNAATVPKDITSANISAVINNVMRFLIASHPLSLVAFNNSGPKRERHMEGRDTRLSPTLCYVGGRGSLFRALCVYRDPTTVRQPGYLSSRREVHRLCAPASRRACPFRRAAGPDAASATYSCEREGYVRKRSKCLRAPTERRTS